MDRMQILEGTFHDDMAREATANGSSWIHAWISSGRHLENSADLLWQPLEIHLENFKRGLVSDTFPSIGPFLLLAGFAVENYLKALCVKGHGANDKKGRFKFGHHDFLKLAGDTGVAFDAAELELIERLEHYVLFAGRYPAPKNHRSLLPRVHGDGSRSPLNFMKGSDYASWKALCEKLKQCAHN